MKRICAWCRKFMGYKPGKYGEITHGLCEECARKVAKDNDFSEEETTELLKNIEEAN